MPSDLGFRFLQSLLIALAAACLVTALSTFILGENNLFQSGLIPFMTIFAIVLFWLLRSERE
jgi:uncharacterized membrane protein (GlpM family)